MDINMKGCNIQAWFIDELMKEFGKLMKEFKPVFDNCKIKLKVRIIDSTVQLWEDEVSNINRLSKKKLMDAFNKYIIESSGSTMKAVFVGSFDKSGIYHLSYLGIHISSTALNGFILRHIDSIEDVLKMEKIAIRHELGHIMDFMSYEGMTADTLLPLRERIGKEKEEYYKMLANKIPTMEDTIAYYKLEEEANANNLACVDIDEFIRLNKLVAKDYPNLETDLKIEATYKEYKGDKNNE